MKLKIKHIRLVFIVEFFEVCRMSNDLEIFKSKIGKRVAFLRKQKGLTQAKLGIIIDKDFQSISRLERGEYNPSSYLIFQISVALQVDISELFNFDMMP